MCLDCHRSVWSSLGRQPLHDSALRRCRNTNNDISASSVPPHGVLSTRYVPARPRVRSPIARHAIHGLVERPVRHFSFPPIPNLLHTYIHTHPFSSSRLSLSPVWHTLWLIKRWKRVPVGSPIFASLPSFFFSSSFIIHHVEIVFHLFYFIFLRSRGKWCVGSDTDLVIFSCGCLENSRRNCSLLFSRHTWIS